MPLYIIDDEYFCKHHIPLETESPEMAEVFYRRELARVLAHKVPTLGPANDPRRVEYRRQVARILGKGLRVREFKPDVMYP